MPTRSTAVARTDETCSRCGQRVLWGYRDGIGPRWLHRENVDHEPMFGQVHTTEMAAAIEAALDEPRHRAKTGTAPGRFWPGIGEPELTVYTAREHDLAKMSKAKRDQVAADSEDDEEESELEPVEVFAEDVDRKDPRVPQGVRNVLKKVDAAEWRVLSLRYSRGPYLGAKGGSLGVSDFVVLKVRGGLDSDPMAGVASWRNGKSHTVWLLRGRRNPEPTTITALKICIEENPHG